MHCAGRVIRCLLGCVPPRRSAVWNALVAQVLPVPPEYPDTLPSSASLRTLALRLLSADRGGVSDFLATMVFWDLAALLASPLRGRGPDIAVSGSDFDEVGRDQLARDPTLEVWNRPIQLGTCNIGFRAEIGAGSTQFLISSKSEP